jgi:hypothetical protein
MKRLSSSYNLKCPVARTLDLIGERQISRIDVDTGFNPAGKTRRRRQFRHIIEAAGHPNTPGFSLATSTKDLGTVFLIR